MIHRTIVEDAKLDCADYNITHTGQWLEQLHRNCVQLQLHNSWIHFLLNQNAQSQRYKFILCSTHLKNQHSRVNIGVLVLYILLYIKNSFMSSELR